MFSNPGFTLADQLFWIVECFRKSMWAEPRTRGLGALSVAIWNRVRGFERRFSELYAMWKAGTLPKARVRALAHPSPRPSPSRGEGEGGGLSELDLAQRRPASLLPRGLRWLQRVLPWSAATLASRVEPLLAECPEMRAFVADCPQVGRILRPMCRMAGLQPPEWLRLPGRERVRKDYPSPRPSPSRGLLRNWSDVILCC